MNRSTCDRLLDLKAVGLVLTLCLPTFTFMAIGHFTHSHSQTVNFVDHKARRAHAIELLGKHGATAVGADLRWVPGAMESFIYQHVNAKLPAQDRALTGVVTRAILHEAKEHSLDPLFLMAVIERESKFNPRAVGSHGELGMMQIKPSTARWMSEKFGLRMHNDESLFDPVVNIRVSTFYIAQLRDSFKKRAPYYITAYNMGPARTREFMSDNLRPSIYASEVMGNYRSYYSKIESSGKKLSGHFSVAMVQSHRGPAFSQISN